MLSYVVAYCAGIITALTAVAIVARRQPEPELVNELRPHADYTHAAVMGDCIGLEQRPSMPRVSEAL